MEEKLEIVFCNVDGTVDVYYIDCSEQTFEQTRHMMHNDASLGMSPFDDEHIERVYIDGMRVI